MASTTKQMNITAGNAEAVVNATVNDSMPAIPCPDPAGYRYVGARYVPLFADPLQWSSANTYEPLTIVVNEGNSYTSRTYVPVGIDISNTDYWALTGNYNAQVEQYRQEVQQFDDRITAVEEITDKDRPYLVVIGDSYSDHLYSGDRESDDSLWFSYVAKAFNLTPMKFAKSGAGYLRRSETINFDTLLTQAISSIEDKSKVAMVMVYGGVNDISQTDATFSYEDYNSAVQDFYVRLANNFPNSLKIAIGCNTFIDNEVNENNGLNNTLVREIVKQKALSTPAMFIDSTKWLLGHASQFNDVNHPNEYGEIRIAGYVLSSLSGQPTPMINNWNTLAPVLSDGLSISSSVCFIKDDVLHLTGTITIATDTTEANVGTIKLPNGVRSMYQQHLYNQNVIFTQVARQNQENNTDYYLNIAPSDPDTINILRVSSDNPSTNNVTLFLSVEVQV